MANTLADLTGGAYDPDKPLPPQLGMPISQNTTTSTPSSSRGSSAIQPPDLSGIGNALGQAWMTATDPLQRQKALESAGRLSPILSGPARFAAALNPGLSQMAQPGATYSEGLSQEEYPSTPPIFPGSALGAASDLAAESLGPAFRQAFGGAPSLRNLLANEAGEGRVDLGLGKMTGAEPPESPRYVVQRGNTIHTIVDTTTGKKLPLAFSDPEKAEMVAAQRNAMGAPQIAGAKVPEATPAFPSAPEGPPPAKTYSQTTLAGKPAFGAQGTAFEGMSPRLLTKAIQASTPYRSIKEFGAAVRSGEARANGAPEGLIRQFLKGEVEQGLRARGMSEAEIARVSGRAPMPAPTSRVGEVAPMAPTRTVSPAEQQIAAAQAETSRRLLEMNAPTAAPELPRPGPADAIASPPAEHASLADLIRQQGKAQGWSDEDIAAAIKKMGGAPPSGGKPPTGTGAMPTGPKEAADAAKLRVKTTLLRTFVSSNLFGPNLIGLKGGNDIVQALLGTVQIPLSKLVMPGTEFGNPAAREAVLWGGFARGMGDAVKAFKSNTYHLADVSPTDFARIKSGEAGRMAQVAGQAVNALSGFQVVPRLLSGLTAGFMRGWHDLSLYDQAVTAAKGLQGDARSQFISDFVRNPSPEAEKVAQTEAAKRTWTNDNGIVRWLNNFRDPAKLVKGGMNETQAGAIANASWTMLPFARIVTNITARGNEFIPGLNIAGLRDTSIPVSEQAARRVNAALGAGLMLWAASKAAGGEVTGDGPANVNAKMALMNKGWKPNSIRIGDRWIESRALGPLAGIINAVGNYHDEMVYDTKPMNRQNLMERTIRVGQALIRSEMDDLGWVNQASDFVNLIQSGSERNLAQFVASTAGEFTPYSGLRRNIESASSPNTPNVSSKQPFGRLAGQLYQRQFAGRGPGVRRPYTGAAVFAPLLGQRGPANARVRY